MVGWAAIAGDDDRAVATLVVAARCGKLWALLDNRKRMHRPDIDFSKVRPLGSRRDGFEQLVCELALHEPPLDGAVFHRLHGAGGDGGVECFWQRPDGSEDGWQAKYWLASADVDKGQLDDSVSTALKVHDKLISYTIAIPVDPTGPTARKGKSLHEKVYGSAGEPGWLAAWQDQAEAHRRDVDFRVLWTTDLVDRLHAVDADGARTRYWFDEAVLSDSWWRDRLDEAVQAARPKYIAGLAVQVPASRAMAAICGDPVWTTFMADLLAATEKAVGDLDRYDNNPLSADLDRVREAGDLAVTALRAWIDDPTGARRIDAQQALGSARDAAATEEAAETQALTERHGEWDSVGWRQFQAEYQVSFPAAAVDALRDLLIQLDAVAMELDSPVERLAGSRAMVLTGAAGRGKTFLVCDWASQRLREERPTVVVHGKWFSDGAHPLVQLRDMLHLPADLSGDDVLSLLDQAGRTAGAPTLVVIDAINETRPRRMWRDRLDQVAAAFSRHEHVRLVVTVRTHYLAAVVPEELDLPTYEHRGFEGVEADALAEYADYFELEPPATPPAQGEFDNPLFLRLLCEALHAGGRLSLDQAALGLTQVVDLLLAKKNEDVSHRIGAPVNDHLVNDALDSIVDAMAGSPYPWLPRPVAREITLGVWPDRTAEDSLLEALIAEGVLAEDTVPDDDGRDTDVVSVAFERLGQHVLVQRHLRDLTSVAELGAAIAEGPLRGVLGLDGDADSGLLEAFSVLAAERFGVELFELSDLDGVPKAVVLAVIVAGLPWRSPAAVGASTCAVVETALSDSATFAETAEMLFRLSVKPDHPLNADWLTDLLVAIPMAERDAALIPWLHDTWGTSGAVERLIHWSKGDLSNLSAETARLWATTLLWCAGCSDRRVRDQATLGAARLLAVRPSVCGVVLQTMLGVDDDWIVERALDVVHTALLRSGDADDWLACSQVTYGLLAGDVPPSAAIRDSGRALIEAAAARGHLPTTIDLASVQPPYQSAWPPPWPATEDVAPFDSRDYPKLVFSCTDDDFFTYQISWIFRNRQLDLPAVARRIVLDVIELGYRPELHAPFDAHVLHTYGGGRGKPSWIERIGKKYQWIALARLLGPACDHTAPEVRPWDAPPPAIPGPQGDRLRQLDPSVTARPEPQDLRAWVPAYVPAVADDARQIDWIQADDIPSVALAHAVVDGADHVVLRGVYEWRRPKSSDATERVIWLHVTPLLVATGDLRAITRELAGRDLVGHGVHHAPMVTSGFVAEYPYGPHVEAELHVIDYERSESFDVATTRASFDFLGEYGYAPSGIDTVSLPVPAPCFFDGPGRLQWDGTGRWLDPSGVVVAAVRGVNTEGNELTMSKAWLLPWLAQRDLALVWVEEAGKDVYGQRRPAGRLLRSRLRWLRASGDVVDETPVQNLVLPRDDVDGNTDEDDDAGGGTDAADE